MPDATAASKMVDLTIDGRPVSVPPGTSVFDAARMNGITIPTLCHLQNETPVGVCRLCVVDVGARVFAASCVRPVDPGMKVVSNSEPVRAARRTLLELLLSEHPTPCARQRNSGDCELETLGTQEGVGKPRFAGRATHRVADDSSPAIAVDHDACILCDRCIRGCNEIRENYVLARMGKGGKAGIAFDHNQPMGSSSCVSCGECMVSCPTGALTNKRVVAEHMETGEAVDVAELLHLPVFKGVSGTFLNLNKGGVARRKYRAGEIVCREGEFGSTAFYILEGKASVFLNSRLGHVKTGGGARGFLSKLKSSLVGVAEHQREGEARRGSIPIDGPVDLPFDNPINVMGPGDLFGEMTCMNFYPRSATVRAETDCTMLEMLRNVLDVMQRNKTFRAQMDQTYRSRALTSHLYNVPLFSGLSEDFLTHLRDRVTLRRYAPGEVIVRQGDPATTFYLIRLGFVRVSEQFAGGELVLGYYGRGAFFGEIGLLGGGIRTATCTALDHAECVLIDAADFDLMIHSFPDVRKSLEEEAAKRLASSHQRVSHVGDLPIDTILTQGLMEAQSLLLLNLENCTRCDACVRACADAHDGVTRLVRDGLRFDKYLVATSCRQCRDPLCMVGCPVGAIRRRQSLEVIIEDWCIGCGQCAENCPYGNINLQPFEVMVDDPERPGRKIAQIKKKATSCDLCHEHAEPSCVYACPHDAAHRVDPATFFQQLAASGRPAAQRK